MLPDKKEEPGGKSSTALGPQTKRRGKREGKKKEREKEGEDKEKEKENLHHAHSSDYFSCTGAAAAAEFILSSSTDRDELLARCETSHAARFPGYNPSALRRCRFLL